MRFCAEVRCYLCGRVSGAWTWSSEGSSGERGVLVVPGRAVRQVCWLWQVRCAHCGGAVFLDEVQPVRPLPNPLEWRPRRRGRPPKAAQPQAS
jgi:hypothetical protein